MAKGSGKSKGGDFERWFCGQLSNWWEKGRTDIFWRSSTSGGRATVRSKKGLDTFGQHGDIAAVDPCGAPLTSLTTIECKTGYGAASFADVLDTRAKAGVQVFEDFLSQVVADWMRSKRRHWMLVSKRNQRVPIVCMPWAFYQHLIFEGSTLNYARPNIRFIPMHGVEVGAIFATSLEQFFERVSRDTIERCGKSHDNH